MKSVGAAFFLHLDPAQSFIISNERKPPKSAKKQRSLYGSLSSTEGQRADDDVLSQI